jgi:nondiscriminating glutamyl-tRNA synthetase
MAPSPTGYLHIWGLRTALYNYLYAHQHDGTFLLRIEDTDRARYVEGSIENLIETLINVGLAPDEGPNAPKENGPYLQSERLDIYQKYIKELLEKKHAYYCFCSSDRLDELRAQQEELGFPTKYDKKCRFLSEEEVQKNLDAGLSYTIRLAVPENREISFTDTIRGKITVPSKDIDDQVLIKTDGFPTYHFAVVVDDHLMKVTDIIRGDEWIPSTPKHVLLYEAFWWEMPRMSHVPPLVWNNRKKLSKRTGDVSVEVFLEKWFLPEAMLNYIALLGWNPKTTQEIFSLWELIEKFKLEDVHKAGAVFDIERMEWFNAQYIIALPLETLYEKLCSYLKKYQKDFFSNIQSFPKEYNLKVLSELKTRLKTFSEYPELTHFFYGDIREWDTNLFLNEKMKINTIQDVKTALELTLDILSDMSLFLETPEDIKQVFIEKIAAANMKNGQVLWPVRVALSMQQFSPGALECIYILWREKSIERIQKILKDL